jgi:gliding motility-associated-like protein
VSPNITTNYSVTVYQNGCSGTDSVLVTVEEAVSANAGNDVAICEGTSTILIATGGTDYLWNTGETTASIQVNPNTTTVYTVTVSNGTQSDIDSVVVTVNETPTADAGIDVTINQGENAVLAAAEGGDSYLWSTGSTSQSITVNPNATTIYSVTVSKNLCSSYDSVLVTVIESDSDELIADAGRDVSICEGINVTLTATGGTDYLWNTGETTASIQVNPEITTTYTVRVTEGLETDTDSVDVIVKDLPNANAGNDVSILQGESVTLTASGGTSYLWSNGSTSQNITVSPNITTNFIVTVSENGCSTSDSVNVLVEESVIANAGNDVSICEGSNTILTATGGTNYLWNTGETTASIAVDTVGTYSVVTTDGCSAIEKTIIVEQWVSPILGNIQSDGSNILIFTSNAGDFLYSIDGINFQTSNIFFNVNGGHYDVYIKSADCDVIVTSPYIHFYIPKFITPNNDSVNDTFKLSGLEFYSSSEVYIFDRFGKLLFSAKNRSVNWRGTFRNKPLPVSDYWYVIMIEGQEFRGHFTLKR